MHKKEALKVIAERHSTRSFSSLTVDDKDLEVILHAANQAPSAHNQQSWRFLVIKGEKKNGLATLISNRAAEYPRASAALLRMAGRTITSAPVVIAIANSGELMNHGKDLFEIDDHLSRDFFRTMEIQSSSAAVQNLLLAATALGIASVWLGIMYVIKDEILEYLGEPKGEFMAIIALGYPERKGQSPAKRHLDSVVKHLD
jgi:nitroreductase